MQPEKLIENAILERLSYVKDGFFWKSNTIGVYDPVKKVFRKSRSKYLINGVSDILGVYQGRFVAIEVKTAKGRVSENQKRFIDNINKHGGLAFVARSVADVEKGLGL